MHTDRQTTRYMHVYIIYIYIYIYIYMQTKTQTYRPITDRQAYIQSDKQKDRNTDGLRSRHTYRQIHTDRQIHT